MFSRMLLGLPILISQAAWAASNPCEADAIPRQAQGLCNAYVYGKKCMEPDQADAKSCPALERNFLKVSGGMPITKALAYTGVTKTMPVTGGEIILPGIAKASFPDGSFTQDTVVRMFITSDPKIVDIYDSEAAHHDLPPLIDYQVRVDVGDNPNGVPYKTVLIDMLLDKETTGLSTEEYIYSPLIMQEEGSEEEYPHVEPLIDYARTSQTEGTTTLTAEVPMGAFIKTPELTNSSYQAIATLMAQKKKH